METFFKKNKTTIMVAIIVLAAAYYWFKVRKPKQAAKKTTGAGSGSVGGGGVSGGISVDPSAGDELVNLGLEDEMNVSDGGVDTPVSLTVESSEGDLTSEFMDTTEPILTDSMTEVGFGTGGGTYAITGDYCKTASGGDGKVNNYGECEAFDYSTQTQTN